MFSCRHHLFWRQSADCKQSQANTFSPWPKWDFWLQNKFSQLRAIVNKCSITSSMNSSKKFIASKSEISFQNYHQKHDFLKIDPFRCFLVKKWTLPNKMGSYHVRNHDSDTSCKTPKNVKTQRFCAFWLYDTLIWRENWKKKKFWEKNSSNQNSCVLCWAVPNFDWTRKIWIVFRSNRMARIRKWLGRSCGQHICDLSNQQNHVQTNGPRVFNIRGIEAIETRRRFTSLPRHLTTSSTEILQYSHNVRNILSIQSAYDQLFRN